METATQPPEAKALDPRERMLWTALSRGLKLMSTAIDAYIGASKAQPDRSNTR